MAAAIALIAMPAERGRAASPDGAALSPAARSTNRVAIDESTAGSADNVSHLEGCSLHLLPVLRRFLLLRERPQSNLIQRIDRGAQMAA